jgi:glycosyltransferase involved in cell wall biosynthesis
LLVGYEREQQGYGARLRATAEALGVGDNVVIGPYPGPIGDVWQTVDIHAHPTMLDSLPNAILEGMSLGKPVVASAIAGIPTLVAHERTGIVVPLDDVPALADALIRLLDQPEMARAFGEAARRRFDERYTQELLARRMEALFSELAAAR